MLEIYTNTLTVGANAPIQFDSVSIQKGTTATHIGSSTIQLNNCGVYVVHFDGYAVAGAVGTMTIQLRKDGVLQPQAITSKTTGDTTSVQDFGFTTLVQVGKNNTKCCCSSPVVLDFVNLGVALTSGHANVTITKLC